MKNLAKSVFALFLLVVLALVGTGEAPEGSYLVASVVDGDTIGVMMDDEIVKIRLIGADTPETVHPTKPVECFGAEASAFTNSELLNQYVSLEEDSTQSDKDRYGRLLRYVFLEGENFNEKLIRDGYAYEYTYDDPYKYQSSFKSAEQYAASNEIGLWSDDVCVDPS